MLPKVNEIVTAADKKMKEAVAFLEEDLKTCLLYTSDAADE